MKKSRALLRLAAASAVTTVAAGAFCLGGGSGASAAPGRDGLGIASLCPTPSITGVATASGAQAADPGTTVYVTGSALDSAVCSTAVTLGGQPVTAAADSASKLQFAMPAADPGGAVVVTLTDVAGDASASSGQHDFVALPVVTALSATSLTEGQTFSASGHGFSLAGLAGASATASYCGGPAQPAQVQSDTAMELSAPGMPCTGDVVLTFAAPGLSVAVDAGPVTVTAPAAPAAQPSVPAPTTGATTGSTSTSSAPAPATGTPPAPATGTASAPASASASPAAANAPTPAAGPATALATRPAPLASSPRPAVAALGPSSDPAGQEPVAYGGGGTGYQSAGAVPVTSSSLPAVVSGAVGLVAPRTLPLPWTIAGAVLLLVVAAAYLLTLRRDGDGALLFPPVEAPGSVWRVAGWTGAALLVGAYVLTAVSVLMTAFTYWLPGSGGATLPGAALYKATAIVLSAVLTGIAARYGYYYYCWLRSRHDFGRARPVDVAALQARPIPYMKFQVTTRGGARPVVERTVQAVVDVAVAHPWLAPRMSVEVITESADEAASLPAHFAGAPIAVAALCLPEGYRTPNGTGLKARALHYMVERRLEGWNRKPGRTFVVHLDEETVVTAEHTLVLAEYLAGDPRPVSQGPILYPMEWQQAPWLCRAMESLRPFGCSECARVMSNPPPPHLHGSNLVVDEDVENRIGWDFGTVDGEAYVAEDLLFGLRAFALLGRDAFGWHGATMFEQPPLSVYWAVQQRLRWVLGALQGWRAMNQREDLRSIPSRDRARLRRAVGFRIATYALGFPVGFAGLYFLVHHPAREFAGIVLFAHHPLRELESIPLTGVWRLAITIAGIGWLLSYQIGLARNLRYQKVGFLDRLRQHLVLLVMTPVTGMFETAGPFVALTRWLAGARQARWTPTPKASGSETPDAAIASLTTA